MTLAAGRLRERITIQSATTTQAASGQPIRTWSAIATSVPAEVLAVNGGETVRGRQVSANAKYVVTVRYRSDVTEQMRLVWNGQALNIVWLGDPYGDRRELRIECQPGPAVSSAPASSSSSSSSA
jgi:SPP1 family predicted phage head-tail adaptor